MSLVFAFAISMCSFFGFSLVIWSLFGLMRLFSEKAISETSIKITNRVSLQDVAVLIPAHNEEATLPKCIASLSRIIPGRQIFVGSDGSSDNTVQIARDMGCNVSDIQPNRGKARALEYLIEAHDISRRFKAVLIYDADSEIDPNYFRQALPLFNDPDVVAIAGHVLSKWEPGFQWSAAKLIAAYRTRLYRLLQATLRYGQTWKWSNVSYIVPGFASMYRTRVLSELDISAPGLVIEDFNMTFELHRKKLGRIAYTPRATCASQDPPELKDYLKQLKRWNLGFWQTLWRNGVWPSVFSASVGVFSAEMLIISLFLIALPLMFLVGLVTDYGVYTLSVSNFEFAPGSLTAVIYLLLASDYILTIIVSYIEKKPSLLVYGLAFPVLRVIDAVMYLYTFVISFSVISDGRWASPKRQVYGLTHMHN